MPEERDTNEEIRLAFQKAKHDIYSLYSKINSLKRNLSEMRHEITQISEILSQITQKIQDLSEKEEKQASTPSPTHPTIFSTHRHINPAFPAQNKVKDTYLELNNTQKQPFSTGNEGVPTDRQTDQQTDNTSFSPINRSVKEFQKQTKTPIEDAAEILESLDGLKKEIRLKFKQLTDQEILVFSTLYQLEEERGPVDYKTLANKLGLTESSIRDYMGRLLKKGIPIEKKKINNKQIQLGVSQSLKKIASLPTILRLRDI